MKRIALFGAITGGLCAPGVVLADMNYTNFEVDYLDLEMGTVASTATGSSSAARTS